MKIGDKIKIKYSPYYQDIVGFTGLIISEIKGSYGKTSFCVELDERPLIGGTRWCFGIEHLEPHNLSQSNGTNCIRCNLFNEFQTETFTCWSCKNGTT